MGEILNARREDSRAGLEEVRRALAKRLEWVTVNTQLNPTSLRKATGKALLGLEALMAKLAPTWRLPEEMRELLVRSGLPTRE